LRAVIANLEKQDIGWIDILSTMANIVEQRGDDQLPEALEAAALTLKRNRKVIRDL
jgi:H2-forming N5,N10-methylenetetrahydromethanopterin dehydrogenase-like enzyme